jgi:hypothetical protein
MKGNSEIHVGLAARRLRAAEVAASADLGEGRRRHGRSASTHGRADLHRQRRRSAPATTPSASRYMACRSRRSSAADRPDAQREVTRGAVESLPEPQASDWARTRGTWRALQGRPSFDVAAEGRVRRPTGDPRATPAPTPSCSARRPEPNPQPRRPRARNRLSPPHTAWPQVGAARTARDEAYAAGDDQGEDVRRDDRRADGRGG